MNKILLVHNCKSIDRVMILGSYVTQSGTQMLNVTFIKPDGNVDLRSRRVYFANQEADARDFFATSMELDLQGERV